MDGLRPEVDELDRFKNRSAPKAKAEAQKKSAATKSTFKLPNNTSFFIACMYSNSIFLVFLEATNRIIIFENAVK